MKLRISDSWILLALAVLYFVPYVGTGVCPPIFTQGLQGVSKVSKTQYLYYATVLGSMGTCGIIMLMLGWPARFKSATSVRIGPISFPREYLYLAPSGVCTAIIILATTMMYILGHGVNVLIAMVMMRGCVVVDGRIVDAIQIRLGILRGKKVDWLQNLAVVFAIAAVTTAFFKKPPSGKAALDPFTLFHSVYAMAVLGSYMVAYLVRTYFMNWYKNVVKGADNIGYLVAEQAFAATTVFIVTVVALVSGAMLLSGSDYMRLMADVEYAKAHPYLLALADVQHAATHPNLLAVASGIPFGLAAIPAVLILMYKERNATVCTLVNRLTSLLAGTVATLWAIQLGSKDTLEKLDWIAFGLVLVAVGFLVWSELKQEVEKKRAAPAQNGATASA